MNKRKYIKRKKGSFKKEKLAKLRYQVTSGTYWVETERLVKAILGG